MSIEKLHSCFLTPWEYDSVHDLGNRTYHLWRCKHREGYTAFALTHQPSNDSKIDFIKPKGTAHWVGENGLYAKMGIKVTE